jgi:hypothetical protein
MDLHIKAIKGEKESWGNRSIHVLGSVVCDGLSVVVAPHSKVSTIPIRRDINKTSQSREIFTLGGGGGGCVCVYAAKTYTHTLTELIIQKREERRFRVARDRREPRKRIDLDLSRHFMVNFVSTADETRIIR